MVNLATTVNPTAFIQHRLTVLSNEARSSQQATDGSKAISLAALMFCVFNSANPVAMALLFVAGLNYSVCIAVDAYRTRGLYLFPIWRVDGLKFLDEAKKDTSQLYQLKYLRPEEVYEYQLLSECPHELIQALSVTPQDKRKIEYQRILATRLTGGNTGITRLTETTITASQQQPTQQPTIAQQTPTQIAQHIVQPQTPEPSPWDTVNTDDIITIPTGTEAANGGRAIDLLLDNPLLTRAIIAGQRTGKTHLASIATWSIQRQHSVKVHYLNLYDHGQGNKAAFSHADNCLTFNWPSLNEQQRIKVAKVAIKLIEYFIQGPSGQILVIDEWMSLGAKLPKFNTEIPESVILMNEFWRKLFEQLTQINSVGIATGKAIYAIMPYFQAGALRDEAKAIKNASPIILAVRPRHFIEWQDPITKNIAKIGYDPKITSDVAFNWRLPINNPTTAQVIQWESNGDERIYYAGGEWNEIGKMPCKPTTSV
jgi:hypothetical protein